MLMLKCTKLWSHLTRRSAPFRFGMGVPVKATQTFDSRASSRATAALRQVQGAVDLVVHEDGVLDAPEQLGR